MAAFTNFLEQLNTKDFDVDKICLVAGQIQNFQLDTLPAAKKFWAQTGNWKALKKLIDTSNTSVSYEKEIECAYEAGRYKACCKLIFYEILLMDNITEDDRFDQVEELPAMDELKLLFDKFQRSDDPILQQFCDEVTAIFEQKNPHRVSWSITSLEDSDLAEFVKIWKRWIVEYDTTLKIHTHKMRKAFLTRMKTLCCNSPSIQECIKTEATRWNIRL